MTGQRDYGRVPIRLVTALAIAAACTSVVSAAIDFETVPFALVMTGLVTPGMVAFVLLDTSGRARAARMAYAAWAVSWLAFFGLSTLAARDSTDGSAPMARMSLTMFAIAAIAAFIALERGANKTS